MARDTVTSHGVTMEAGTGAMWPQATAGRSTRSWKGLEQTLLRASTKNQPCPP